MISPETAFDEEAHLEQRIEEVETTIHNINSEWLEQMFKVALMKDTIDLLETEMKRLTRKVLDFETELSQQEADYVSLSLLNEKTEQNLSETQQSLVKKKHEMKLSQEEIMLLDEKNWISILPVSSSFEHKNGYPPKILRNVLERWSVCQENEMVRSTTLWNSLNEDGMGHFPEDVHLSSLIYTVLICSESQGD
ncbi:hypothetical protein WISP_118203 [Willisornis vidua]|uniref:Uncharacterized protein n=1 Tax=Willisornis vidua TaxID=1566151 RepID=A0ABQ9CWA0_9PASS|nr:hypothetical protein WISP_118203 [Willisornis vidua]